MPTSVIPDVVGMGVLDMLVKTGLLPSKGEARRLVQQNGLSINDVKYNDVNGVVTEDMITDEGMIIKRVKRHSTELLPNKTKIKSVHIFEVNPKI